jgi:phenylacetate-CoA ligase
VISIAQQVYPHLPFWARCAAVNVRGYYLRRSRYDANTERLVEEALERDYWSPDEWERWRAERLSFILHRAATRVPYYRDQWAERRRNGDRSSWEYLENWNVLEKKDLREMNPEFVADDCMRSKMYCDNTSGTTGTSLSIWLTRETVKRWYALFEARCRRWYGVSLRDRWAILGGQLVTPVKQNRPPFWVWNGGLNQLYMSAYHLSREQLVHYLDAIAKYRIKYILGYPSAVYCLAGAALEQRRSDIALKVVIANAEPLYDHQREAIEAAFACPVRESYGMVELAAAASECERGGVHEWPDAGIVTVLPDRGGEKGAGDLVCTGLVNADMPLIRYRVGDRGRLSNERCECGRTLPLLAGIDGRIDDVLYTPDGRSIGRLDPVFKGGLPIVEAQNVQLSLDKLAVRYVPGRGIEERALREVTRRIRDRMGDVSVNFEAVEQIPRTTRGKFRAVVCQLSPKERSKLRSVQNYTPPAITGK